MGATRGHRRLKGDGEGVALVHLFQGQIVIAGGGRVHDGGKGPALAPGQGELGVAGHPGGNLLPDQQLGGAAHAGIGPRRGLDRDGHRVLALGQQAGGDHQAGILVHRGIISAYVNGPNHVLAGRGRAHRGAELHGLTALGGGGTGGYFYCGRFVVILGQGRPREQGGQQGQDHHQG